MLTRLSRRGFTIVELLIVIVIMGILSVVALNSIGDTQERARIAQAQSEVTQLSEIVQISKINSSQALSDITGSGCSDCPCRPLMIGTAVSTGTSCWNQYLNVLGTVSAASGGIIDDLYEGDPWGNPYLIDENEGEYGPGDCRNDLVSSAGPDLIYNTDDDITKVLALQISC